MAWNAPSSFVSFLRDLKFPVAPERQAIALGQAADVASLSIDSSSGLNASLADPCCKASSSSGSIWVRTGSEMRLFCSNR